MDAVLPAVYQFIEAVHIFIPLLAILACVIIFACSSAFTSKATQPPLEYLENISKTKVVAMKQKAKPSKTLKTLQKLHSPPLKEDKSPEQSPNHADENVANARKVKQQQQKEKRPKHVQGNEVGEEWITVINSKQKKRPIVMGSLQQQASVLVNGDKSQEEHHENSSTQKTPHSEDESGGDTLLSKDSRYSKKNVNHKRKNFEKRIPAVEDIAIKEIVGGPSNDEFVKVEARKRKAVRRET